MTRSVKKRTSKWDLKVDTDVPAESIHDNTWPGKPGESIHYKESSSGLNSLKVSGSQDPMWSNMESNKSVEQFPTKRGVDLDDSLNRDIDEISHSITGWGGDQSCSSSMSPGLDAWRQQNQKHSPKSSWRSLRSRSRSPLHGFKQESDLLRDGSSSGSGVSATTCNDFAAGRCRRGSQCRFLHQDSSDYEVRRHSEHGRADNLGGRHDDGRHLECDRVERWRGRPEDSGSSGSGPAGNWRSRNERGSFSRHSNNDELLDYSQDMISHGYGDSEKHKPPRNDRSTNRCNDFLRDKCCRGSSFKYAHHDVLGDGHGGWSKKDVTRDWVHDKREAHEYDHGRRTFRNNGIPCKYFAAGNCRNGAHCRFSHDGAEHCSPEDRSQGDRWGHNLDTEEKSCGVPNWSDTAAAPDVAKDDSCRCNVDDKDNSFRGPKWSDTAIGSDVAKDHRWGHNSDIEPNSWRDPNMSDAAAGSDVAQDDKWGHSLGNEPNSWVGPKYSDTAAAPDVAKSPHCRTNCGDGQVGFYEPWATKRPKDQWGHSSDNENRPWEGPMRSDKAVGQIMFRTPHPSENNGASMSIPESIVGSKPLDVADTSAAAAVMERYPFYIEKKEHRQFPEDSQSRTPYGIYLPTLEHKTSQEVLQQHLSLRGDTVIAFPYRDSDILPMLPMPGQRFNHDDQSGRSSSFNMIGQSEQIVPPHPSSGQTLNLSGIKQTIMPESSSNKQGQTLVHMGGHITKSETEDAKTSKVTSLALLTHNVVTSEQAMNTLSASLAQIFGNGQQLPLLYAALNPPNSIGLVPSQQSPAAMSTAVTLLPNDPNQITWSQKPYDPRVSIESSRLVTSNQPPGFSSSPFEQNKVAEQMPLKSSFPSWLKNKSSDDTLKHESQQLETVAACEAVVKNDKADQGNKEENIHSEDMNVDGHVDEECKRKKDSKAMRMLKFALVEFVKEILKPTWKGGQMSKEVHKTIVKKVVDKVIGTIEEAHVPQTQEKVDQYLSFSKPKLMKLVQAYVERYLKSDHAGKP
ncbi:zinc finger CCCH domain-containing protein 55-like isoform X2 [Macadamia integrifolia]|uniref:zinc finger CCCH domain-containing protein 55-like isoform X2 n=1 Tax=Macadamia integrifolia TaxID=60698 RepID=UPI001C4E4FD0|nr:zinc finger CCCH domain-containing protein 55-like isoform X2 [Macadamia integrifolia]